MAPCATLRLWLCLYFHDLPLEVFAGPSASPRAILSEEGRQGRILLCEPRAAELGVRPGMPVNAALALAPGLQIERRDRRLEREALERLAAWAVRFTPLVSIDPGNALLLEVGSSLRFFAGLDGLCGAVSSGVRSRGHAVAITGAPTARAALWLARAGVAIIVTDRARLRAALARLPLGCLGWPERALGILQRMGVMRVGDCLRLPRDGLARRIGAAWLRELDEALGRQPEAREGHRPPEQFNERLELAIEASGSGPVLAALRVLLARLSGGLESRQAGAQTLWIRLHHRTAADTWLRIGLLRPSADVRHLLRLAELHVAAARIPAPVVAVELQADSASLQPASADLLGSGADHGELLATLLERLRARLGFHSVHGIRTAAGHRPERAWHVVAEPRGCAGEAAGVMAPGQRPLWLLENPLPLHTRLGQPWCDGELVPAAGPERIESGWWDGHDVRRDYYLMRNPQGARLWVFRDRRDGAWYLHGIFG